MSYCFTTLILLGLSVILAMITLVLDGKRRVSFGVGAVAAEISALISFATMSIPKPEIYTTNGNRQANLRLVRNINSCENMYNKSCRRLYLNICNEKDWGISY